MRYSYSRRHTCSVHIGSLVIGSSHDIALQTMANVSTMETEACVQQALSCYEKGCSLFRYTAQGTREASNLQAISQNLRKKGCTMPLVADIHFTRGPAFEALKHVEKVRINPGNFVDNRTSDPSLFEETQQLVQCEFGRFVEEAILLNRAIRIGVNHGSLSARMLERYGNTPNGMVESCLEYLRVCQQKDFHNVVISMKSSNVSVMTEAVRLLAHRLDTLNMPYPLHLGVTEAGADEDGRIKSAVGIGSLLMDGLGDTFRVSLSEEPYQELIFGNKLLAYINRVRELCSKGKEEYRYHWDDYRLYHRNQARQMEGIGGSLPPVTVALSHDTSPLARIDFSLEQDNGLHLTNNTHRLPCTEIDLNSEEWITQLPHKGSIQVLILKADKETALYRWRKALDTLGELGFDSPIILRYDTLSSDPDEVLIEACLHLGSILLQGAGNGIMLTASNLTAEFTTSLVNGILQAVRLKMTHTEFISCPGCGRTLFDLQEVVREIKKELSHLNNLKIGVMGCIVNGPGEMADADYGYVGAGVGKIDLYKGKERALRGIDSNEAVEKLKQLIREHGDWKEPPHSISQ